MIMRKRRSPRLHAFRPMVGAQRGGLHAGRPQARADARNAQQWGSPIYVSATDAPQGTHSAIEAHVAADLEVLRKTLDGLAQTRLDELVTALHDARRVLVIGHRNSALLATYARGQLGLLRAGVELAPMHGETLAEGLFGLGPQDVLLAATKDAGVPGTPGSFAALGAAPKYCWFGGVLALAITVTVMLGMGRLGPTLAVATILIRKNKACRYLY